MRLHIFLIMSLLLFAGCAANYQTLKQGNIDADDKSISVPGVGNALFEIKSALVADGWTVKIDDSTLNEKGTVSAEMNTTTKVAYDTRYRMYISSTRSISGGDWIIRFNISIVDNQTNQEVLNMLGNGDELVPYDSTAIAAKLLATLKELEM